MQKKFFQMALTLLFVIVFALTTVSMHAPQAHAATTHTSAQQPSLNSASSSEPTWIIKAAPYIHISDGIATIDPAVRSVLSPNDVTLVTQTIQRYNTIPYATKIKGATSTNVSAHTKVTPNASCSSNSGAIYGPFVYWWGTAYTLNHCFIVQLWLAVYIDGSTAGGIALICAAASAGICALFAALAGAYILATVKALNDADAQCGGQGANLNFTSGGIPPWVNSVC